MTHDVYQWIKPENWRNIIKKHQKPSAEVMDLLNKQNEEFEDFLSDTQDLQTELEKEILTRQTASQDNSLHQSQESQYRLIKPVNSSYPDLVHKDKKGNEKTVFSFLSIARKYKYFKLDKVKITANGQHLIYSYDCRANESFRIAIYDLTLGKHTDHFISNTTGKFVLSPDSSKFYYLSLNRNHRPTKLYRHTIGKSRKEDVSLFTEKGNKNFLKISSLEDDEHLTLISDNERSVMIKFLSMKTEKFIHFKSHKKGEIIRHVKWHDGSLYFCTNTNGRHNFALFQTGWKQFKKKHWKEIIPCIPGSVLKDFHLGPRYISIIRTNGTGFHLYHYDTHKHKEHPVKIKGRTVCEMEFNDPTIKVTSPIDPPITHTLPTTKIADSAKTISFPHSNKDYILERIVFKAHDKTEIPVTIARRKTTKLDGSAPLLVTAYGAYGHVHDMEFKPEILSLLDQHFVYAIIHVRGGGEKGHKWRVDGRQFKKKNTCTDFIAGVEHLIAEKVAHKDKIIGYGYSAGGIVVGYAANNRPDLFKLIIADMPFVDVLNTMQDKSLPLTPMEWEEWGNPLKSKKAYSYIKSYCPYQNIKEQNYPHIIALGGLYDPRVMYWEPAKWISRIKDLNTADTKQMLYTNMEVGHWGYFSKKKSSREIAKIYAAMLKCLNSS